MTNWFPPTGHDDVNNEWQNEANAYDDNIGTYANTDADDEYYLELICAEMLCKKIRIYANRYNYGSYDPDIDVDVYYDSGWHNINSGIITKDTWVEISIPAGEKSLTKMRIKGNAGSGDLRLFEAQFGGDYGYVNPTNFEDYMDGWINEVNAYDDDIDTYAKATHTSVNWTDFLGFTHSAINCNKVRINVKYHTTYANTTDVDVYYGDAWHDIWQGTPPNNKYKELSLGGTYSVTKIRIKMHITDGTSTYARIYETDFFLTPVVGWPHKWNTQTISKWNTKEFSKWNGLQ